MDLLHLLFWYIIKINLEKLVPARSNSNCSLIVLWQMTVFLSEGIVFREVKVTKGGAGVHSDRKSQLVWGLIFDVPSTFCFVETKA